MRDGVSSMIFNASMAALASMGGSEAEKQYLMVTKSDKKIGVTTD